MLAFHGDPKVKKKYIPATAVSNELTRLGFEVLKTNHQNANGTDMQASKNGVCYNFEIKQASKTTRSWRVGKTFSKTDDYVAIVFPKGDVHIEPMSEHLMKCSADGSRRITALAKIYA